MGRELKHLFENGYRNFYQKKYGITSGYIIPNLYSSSLQLYHFDIIIYNQQDAPILWIEGNQDQSELGKSKAIPAKYVVAVYEVKSRITKATVSKALDKLNQISSFAEQLNKNYSCGIIFIELKSGGVNKKVILKKLLESSLVFGFAGGVILRYEEDPSITGIITLNDSELSENNDEHSLPIAKPIDMLNIYLNEKNGIVCSEKGAGIKLTMIAENTWAVSKHYFSHYTESQKEISIFWSRSNFSAFCIHLLSQLENISFTDMNRPSFGRVFDEVARKTALTQNNYIESGKPFLEITIQNLNNNKINYFESSNSRIEFKLLLKNSGDQDLVFSDDFFKSEYKLCVGMFASKTLKYELESGYNSFGDAATNGVIKIPFRIVYHPVDLEDEFYAVEQVINITENNIELINSQDE